MYIGERLSAVKEDLVGKRPILGFDTERHFFCIGNRRTTLYQVTFRDIDTLCGGVTLFLVRRLPIYLVTPVDVYDVESRALFRRHQRR